MNVDWNVIQHWLVRWCRNLIRVVYRGKLGNSPRDKSFRQSPGGTFGGTAPCFPTNNVRELPLKSAAVAQSVEDDSCLTSNNAIPLLKDGLVERLRDTSEEVYKSIESLIRWQTKRTPRIWQLKYKQSNLNLQAHNCRKLDLDCNCPLIMAIFIVDGK